MDKVKDIIRDEIRKYAIDKLSNKQTKQVKPARKTEEETLIEKNNEESSAHNALFFALEDEKFVEQFKQRYIIKEAADDKPVILKSDLEGFKQDFYSNVTRKGSFDKQKNNEILYAFKSPSGIEAICSGFIPLNTNENIKWTFSIQNGPSIDVGAELNDDLVDIISKLNSYYISWKNEWLEKLSNS